MKVIRAALLIGLTLAAPAFGQKATGDKAKETPPAELENRRMAAVRRPQPSP